MGTNLEKHSLTLLLLPKVPPAGDRKLRCPPIITYSIAGHGKQSDSAVRSRSHPSEVYVQQTERNRTRLHRSFSTISTPQYLSRGGGASLDIEGANTIWLEGYVGASLRSTDCLVRWPLFGPTAFRNTCCRLISLTQKPSYRIFLPPIDVLWTTPLSRYLLE